MEIGTQSRAGGAACLRFLRCRARSVGRSAVPSRRSPLLWLVVVGLASLLRSVVVVWASLSSCHRFVAACLPLAYRLGLVSRGCGGGVIASPLCGCRAACRIARAGRAAAFSSPCCVLRACLPCDGVVSLISPSHRQDGRGDGASAFRRRSGRSHRSLIGFSSAWVLGSALLAPFIRIGGGLCLRCDAGVRMNGCGRGWSVLLLGAGSVLPTHRPPPCCCFASSRCHALSLVLFPFALPPRCGLLLACGLRIIPRPPGRGEVAGCGVGLLRCRGRGVGLLASHRVVSLTHCVRSLSSCLRLGSYSRASSFPACLVGPRWSVIGARSLSSPPCSLVPCVSCFVIAFAPPPRLIRRVRSACRLVACPLRPRLGDSVGVAGGCHSLVLWLGSCHPIGEVPCFAP